MSKLTDRKYWDTVHGSSKKLTLWERIKGSIRRQLDTGWLRVFRSYSESLLWERTYAECLPRTEGLKVIEIGCAPGDTLIRLKRDFGYIPYGVEYSSTGTELCRKNFTDNGLDPTKVIEADFFSDKFTNEYREFFDVVVSSGFIEHFDDVTAVVERHLELLKPGGTLVVSIPNLKGINRLMSQFFHRETLEMHNLEIMDLEQFTKLFPPSATRPLFCDYIGSFDFNLFNTKEGSPRKYILQVARKFQRLFNALLRILFGVRGFEGPSFSKYLLYVGVKK